MFTNPLLLSLSSNFAKAYETDNLNKLVEISINQDHDLVIYNQQEQEVEVLKKELLKSIVGKSVMNYDKNKNIYSKTNQDYYIKQFQKIGSSAKTVFSFVFFFFFLDQFWFGAREAYGIML